MALACVLPGGLVTLLDADALELVGGRRLSLSAQGYVLLAGRLLHRRLLGLRPHDGQVVDHINRCMLDNRRANLRLTSKSLNGLNRAKARRIEVVNGQYRARIQVHGQRRRGPLRPTLVMARADLEVLTRDVSTFVPLSP